MNKEVIKSISLDPFFQTTTDSKLVVWSHDSNSFKIDMELSSNTCPMLLTGAIPRILLQFKPDDQIRIYPLTVESEHQGFVSFYIPNEILGFEGEVYAHVYVDFESKSHDLGSFKFCMKQSVIDSEFKELDTLYVKEFEKAVEKIKLIDQYETDYANLIGNSTKEFNDFLTTSQKKIDNALSTETKLETTVFREYERNNNYYVSQLQGKVGEVEALTTSLSNAVATTVRNVDKLGEVVTPSKNGLMSKSDKVKLDNMSQSGGSGGGITLGDVDARIKPVSDLANSLNNEMGKVVGQIETLDKVATPSKKGLMSASDKNKLDNMSQSGGSGGGITLGDVDARIKPVSDLANSLNNEIGYIAEKADAAATKKDLNALKSVATVTENGLMSAVDKVKLDDLETLIKPKSTILYKGAGMYFDETQGLDIDLDKMNAGVHIIFSFYDVGIGPRDIQFQPFFISKELITAFPGVLMCLLGNGSTVNARKQLKYTNKRISGVADNKTAPNNAYALRLAYYI